ncbi:MAG: hypothetical protein F8N15_00360 [Methanobacterium sp.]|nr:hypothetical protein [Methanobacterium sp.]
MVLAMSRPFKHPKTGVYWFRKVVPEDLRSVVGKREVTRTLKTKDVAEAKIRHAVVAAEIELKWKALRSEPNSLSQPEPLTYKQIVALAGEEYRAILDRTQEDPGDSAVWEAALHASRVRGADGEEVQTGPIADALLLRKGICTDGESRAKLISELAKTHQQVAQLLKRNAEGYYQPDPDANRFPAWTEKVSVKWTLTGLVEDWWKEANAAGTKPATYESYSNAISKFVAFLGHDDASRVTADDVIAFKDYRLAEINPRTGKPISAKTVKDSDLTGLKSVFGWAVANGRMGGSRRKETNPATGVTIKLGKKPKLRPKGFTDEEAGALLRAAWAYKPGREHRNVAAARGW